MKWIVKAQKLIGEQFGRWTIVEAIPHGFSKCVCICGNYKTLRTSHLLRGASKSCGCYARDVTIKRKLVHGQSYTATYRIWCSMRSRCSDKNSPKYKDYGGRGITVCERWNSYENFLEDMGEKPQGMSIDRINNAGSYDPTNCRWATSKEQGSNKRNNKYIKFNGETKTASEWSRVYGLSLTTLNRRIDQGWPVEIALTKQPIPHNLRWCSNSQDSRTQT